MKKLILVTLLISTSLFSLLAQAQKSDMLQDLENKRQSNQTSETTATLKYASRLFGDQNDLTSVMFIIPADSVVTVIESDSIYLNVIYQGAEGYIYKRDAMINKTPVVVTRSEQPAQQLQETQPEETPQMSRFSYLENKYGSNMAARLMAGKIWKGMNSDMVNDSWGTAQKINRVISGNVIKEEWVYRNTWLYFENNILVDWGPVKQ